MVKATGRTASVGFAYARIRASLSSVVLTALLLGSGLAQAALTVTPITWDIVGLDHNRPLTSGPELFPVGARVCSDVATSDVDVALVWDEGNPFIDFRPGSLMALSFDALGAGECADAYFEIQLQRSSAAFGQSRRYRIEASDANGVAASPTPRAIYIERLVSQNRNSTQQIRYGQQVDQSDWVILGGGGSLHLAVGQTYFIELSTQTATAYDQLESFLTLSNTIFQIKSVSTTYSTLTAPPSRVPVPNPSLYADGCLWESDLDSPNWRSCLSTGKAGGVVVTVYEIAIISGGGESVGLEALIYDLSGGSFHYNTDFSQSPGDASTFDPEDAGFAKRFIPSTIGADGVATLRFTISNPNPIDVEGYRFTDNLPGAMVVANPANASSTCGGTLTALPGSAVIEFEDGAIGANGTCTILVSVTVPFDPLASYPLVLNNVADLFVGDATDPSATAEASLEVTEEPPPPLECSVIGPGTSVAEWGSFTLANNPNHPTTGPLINNIGLGTAAGLGNTTTVTTNRWVGNTLSDAGAPDKLANARSEGRYFEFILDTTGIDAVDLSFLTSRQNGNAPSTVTLDYGPAGSFTLNAATWGPVSTSAGSPSTFSVNNLTNLDPEGPTFFRLYIYDAANPNIEIRIHQAFFTGSGTVCNPVDPGDAPTPPSIAKSFSPDTVRVGEVSTLSFIITNPNAADALSGLTFRDELPTGMQAVAGTFVNGGCGGTWGLEAGDPGILLLDGGSLAANTQCTLSVDVTATAIGSNVNISDPVDAIETLPGNSAIDILDVLPPPLAPSIVKLFDPNPLLDPDGVTALVFRITNNDPDLAISQVAFSDSLPEVGGVQMQPAVVPIVFADNGQCGGAFGFTWDAITSTLSFSNGEIAAASVCEIALDVIVPGLVPLDLPALFPNETSAVSHIFEGIAYLGNQASATLLVDQPIPGISILKQVGPGSDLELDPWSNYFAIAEGGDVFYKITIENIGETVLTDISVEDPAVSTAGCPWTVPGFTLPVADVGDPDAHIAVCVVGPVSAVAGETVNTAAVEANSDAGPVSDFDSATYATTGLTLVKSGDPTTFDGEGEVIAYTFTVTNSGAAILVGPVAIDDPLIGAVTCPALTAIGNFDNFFDPGEQMVCTGSYTITAADVAAGFVTNVAVAFTPEAISDPDSVTVVLNAPAMTVSKALTGQSESPIVEGTVLTYTITATNTGNVPLSNVVVSDPILTPNSANCPSVPVAGTCVLVGTYTVTAADVTAGSISNTGTGNSDETDPVDDTVVTPVEGSPAMTVSKALTGQSESPIVEGTVLTY
ncbi:MAG TPA: hypothetical protein PKZ76_04080, partial [Xanthomonadaceae bacterium]|nr:hypothetical protein [Xanthomonadaceae bacterium]